MICKKGNDVVYTPDKLAAQIVARYKPTGKVLEPCRGGGAFYKTGVYTDWCEILEGKDFFDYGEKVDWIITNPPWGIINKMLTHSFELADDVVFLLHQNHISTKKRRKIIEDAGFYIREMISVPTPPIPFPQTGFQLVVYHFSKRCGDCRIEKLINKGVSI